MVIASYYSYDTYIFQSKTTALMVSSDIYYSTLSSKYPDRLILKSSKFLNGQSKVFLWVPNQKVQSKKNVYKFNLPTDSI